MSYRLKNGESVSRGIARIAREQLHKIRSDIASAGRDPHEAVHEVRKRLKKLRGLARLVRSELGDEYGRFNGWCRSRGRELSPYRDTESLLETLLRMQKRFGSQLDGTLFDRIRQPLLNQRHEEQAGSSVDSILAALAEDLDRELVKTAEWPLEQHGVDAIVEGVADYYGRGRKALKAAEEEPSDEALHDWRKRAKDHWYHMRILRCVWVPLQKARAAECSRLCDLLGDDHDLAVLCQWLHRSGETQSGREDAETLRGTARLQREVLQRKAFEAGRLIYAEKPKNMRQRFASYIFASQGCAGG